MRNLVLVRSNQMRIKKRFAYLILFCCALLPVDSLAQSSGTTEEQHVSIDASAPVHPFPHFWEHIFGSGRAELSLRESYRQDLRDVKQVTGITYVRFHAI